MVDFKFKSCNGMKEHSSEIKKVKLDDQENEETIQICYLGEMLNTGGVLKSAQ